MNRIGLLKALTYSIRRFIFYAMAEREEGHGTMAPRLNTLLLANVLPKSENEKYNNANFHEFVHQHTL